MGFSDVDSDNKPMSFQQTCEKKMLLHQQELEHKEEEMKQQFIQRVKEKESELKEAEREVFFCFIRNSVYSFASSNCRINETDVYVLIASCEVRPD